MLNMMRSSLLALVLLLLVFFLQFHIWLSDSGWGTYHSLGQKIKETELLNQHLVQDNQQLQTTVDNLHQDGELLLNNAREQLGMVGPDEVLYRVSPAST